MKWSYSVRRACADDHWHEKLPAGDDAKVLHPSISRQYDQRADSAAQCIRIIKPEAEPIVKFARVYALYDITEEELDKVIIPHKPGGFQVGDDKKPLSLRWKPLCPMMFPR